MEWVNISSVEGFIFFLLIVVIGYFFVEVVCGRYYPSWFFTKYRSGLLDRVIHYIFWWIILNVAMFFLIATSRELVGDLLKMFNAAGNLVNVLGLSKQNIGGQSQVIIFSVQYFINTVIILGVFACILRIGVFVDWVLGKTRLVKLMKLRGIFPKIRTHYFRKSRYSWIPTTWQGFVITGLLVAFLVHIFLFANTHAHSISDVLYGIFPYWIPAFLLYDWVASKFGE